MAFRNNNCMDMKVSMLVCSLCILPLGLGAQTPTEQDQRKEDSPAAGNFVTRFHGEGWFNAGTKQHGVHPMNVGLRLGYEVMPRLSVAFQYETVMGLVKCGKTSDPYRLYAAPTLGVGLSYRLLGGKEYVRWGKAVPGLNVSLVAGGSVGNASWKQTFTDLRLSLYQRGTRFAWSPVMNAGYRYTHSRSPGMRDMHTFYVGVGLRF